MTEVLIKRLRVINLKWSNAAADLLEQQKARVAELERDKADLIRLRDGDDTELVAAETRATEWRNRAEARAKELTTERKIDRTKLANVLRNFHRHSCYPDAMDGEIDAAVDAVLHLTGDE